jgi:hypothetical protein
MRDNITVPTSTKACSEIAFAMFKRVQETRLNDFQACSVKELQIMKDFAGRGLKFLV